MPKNLFDHSTVEEARVSIMSLLKKSDKLTLNFKSVERIGTAGVQLTLSCLHTVKGQEKKEVTLTQFTEPCEQAFRVMGLEDILHTGVSNNG